LPYILLAMVAGAWVCRIAVQRYDPTGISSHMLMPCRMDDLALGTLAAWATRTPAARTWLAKNLPHWWVPVLIAALPIALLSILHVQLGEWQLPLYGYTCLGVFYASLLYAVVDRQPARLVAVLSWRPLVSLGRLSYFIYLWHTIVMASIAHYLLGHVDFGLDSPAAFGVLVASLGVTWGLAWISWQVFEGPLIRLGHRYAY
jgi:peptidoglycan/LPS O-acetylase OafA/YrhL